MADEVANEFASSLSDLKFNSKPVISMLTMVAEENKDFAPQIVKVIETHLLRTPVNQKLPCLYLIDSIVKNVGKTDETSEQETNTNYQKLFSKNLVFTFSAVFEKVDEKTRLSMWKLRNTWTGLFDSRLLHELDIKVNRIDPNWPVVADPQSGTTAPAVQRPVVVQSATGIGPNIHVNPKFIMKQAQLAPEQLSLSVERSDVQPVVSVITKEPIHEKILPVDKFSIEQPSIAEGTPLNTLLQQKQQELIILQQQVLQQELAAAKAKLDEQSKQLLQQRQQIELQQMAAKQASIAQVVSAVKASAPLSSSNRDPRVKAHNDGIVKSEHQTAVVLPTPAKPPVTKSASSLNIVESTSERSNIFELMQNDKPPVTGNLQQPKPVTNTTTTIHPSIVAENTESCPSTTSTALRKGFVIPRTNAKISPKNEKVSSSSSDRPRDPRRQHRNNDHSSGGLLREDRKPLSLDTNLAKLNVVKGFNVKSPRISHFQSRQRFGRKPDAGFTFRDRERSTREGGGELMAGSRSGGRGSRSLTRVSGRGGGSRPSNSPPTKRKKAEDEFFQHEGQDFHHTSGIGAGASEVMSSGVEGLLGDRPVSTGWAQFKATPTFRSRLVSPPNVPLRTPLLKTPDVPASTELARPSLLATPPLVDDPMQSQLAAIQEMRADLEKKRERLENITVGVGINIDYSNLRYGSKTLLPPPPKAGLLDPPTSTSLLPRMRPTMSSPALLPTPPVPSALLLIPPPEPPSLVRPVDPRRRPSLPPPMELWGTPASPWYDNVRYYVPEHDPRWRFRAEAYEGGRLGPGVGSSDSYAIYIDGRPYDMKLNNRSLRIRLSNTAFEVRLDPLTRKLWVDDIPYYRLGQDPHPVEFADGVDRVVYAHGPARKLWIDQQQFELNVDAPAEQINIGGFELMIRIDGENDRIVVDGHDICPFGGELQQVKLAYVEHTIEFKAPLKQIIIDGRLCNLDLGERYPSVVMDNVRHGIRFNGDPREIYIDDCPWLVPMNGAIKWRVKDTVDGGQGSSRPRLLAFGGPGHEVIIDDQWYEVKFDGETKFVRIGTKVHKIQLRGSAPEVKILGEMVHWEKLIQILKAGVARQPSVPQPVVANPMQDMLAILHGRGYEEGRNISSGYLVGSHSVEHRPNGDWSEGVSGAAEGTSLSDLRRLMTPLFNDGPASRLSSTNNYPQPQSVAEGRHENPNNIIQPSQSSVSSSDTTSVVAPLPEAASSSTVDVNALLTQLLAAGLIQSKKEETVSLPPPAPAGARIATERQSERQLDNISKRLMNIAGEPSAGIKIGEDGNVTEEMKEAMRREEAAIEPVPDLIALDVPALRRRHAGAISALRVGIQCTSCGLRFKANTVDTLYKEHLDWHFRMNKRTKEGFASGRTRGWYYDVVDWIQYEEVTNAEEREAAAAVLEDGNPSESGTGVADILPLSHGGADIDDRPTASGDDGEDTCYQCREAFEQFWDEEAEAWRLKDAVRLRGMLKDEENGSTGVARTYHRICFEDASKDTGLCPEGEGEGAFHEMEEEEGKFDTHDTGAMDEEDSVTVSVNPDKVLAEIAVDPDVNATAINSLLSSKAVNPQILADGHAAANVTVDVYVENMDTSAPSEVITHEAAGNDCEVDPLPDKNVLDTVEILRNTVDCSLDSAVSTVILQHFNSDSLSDISADIKSDLPEPAAAAVTLASTEFCTVPVFNQDLEIKGPVDGSVEMKTNEEEEESLQAPDVNDEIGELKVTKSSTSLSSTDIHQSAVLSHSPGLLLIESVDNYVGLPISQVYVELMQPIPSSSRIAADPTAEPPSDDA